MWLACYRTVYNFSRVRNTNRLGAPLQAGSVRFAASGNFAHYEVNPIDDRHWQLARQAE
jgi:hypothetical protein